MAALRMENSALAGVIGAWLNLVEQTPRPFQIAELRPPQPTLLQAHEDEAAIDFRE